jgi:predicted AlkP superfamily phosphohydrolase/phosphomutase/tetratricopeptide (TPR) repeat protein
MNPDEENPKQPEIRMSERLAKRVLLIGWDAADWKVIHPLMDAGLMPALESIVNQGVIANLATLDPPMSPMLWTSIATGMHADKHGVLNFTEPVPGGKGIRPVMGTTRKTKAIWNILQQSGLKCHVVGWWPSHPAEPINGIMISNFYQRAHAPVDKPWPLHPGTVYPPEKADVFDRLRIHPAELTEAHLLPFVPKAAEIEQEKEKTLASLARIIADCATIHAAATWMLEYETWDFMAVYYDAIDHFSHGFMNFHPPRMKGVPKRKFDLYQHVVSAGYRFHDMMLARLLQLAGDETTVILISDHGFHSDHLRPKGIPKEPAGPAWQHRPYGIFAMRGPSVIQDERIYGAGLLDIAPTVLTLFGLPAGEDMDGKPLIQAFDHPVSFKTIPSWEQVEGDCGRYPAGIQADPYAEQEAMAQLVALGYVDAPDEKGQKQIDRTMNESRFYLARVYMNKNEFEKAYPLLQELYSVHPEEVRYAFQLARCAQQLGQVQQAKDIVRKMIETEEKEYPQLDLLRGTLALADRLYHQALEYLEKAEKADPRLPTLHQQIGQTYLSMNRPEEAEQAFLKALTIDPESAAAHNGLAQVYFRMRRFEASADSALNAVGLVYHYPLAHYNLGRALIKLKDYERAIQAFEVVLAIRPGLRKPRRYLIRLYRQIGQTEKMQIHQKMLKEWRNNKEQTG